MSCQHVFEPSDRKDYEHCSRCNSYHSLKAGDPKEIYTPDYWTHAKGHSTITEQVYNCESHLEGGKSKYAFVLERVKTQDKSSALEIGCAPGKLLLLLRGMAGFDRVVGIEACRDFERDIREIGAFGGPLLFGFFPKVTKSLPEASFSLVIGLDVWEHSPEPEEFVNECGRLLKLHGQVMLMLPLSDIDVEDRFFEPREHIYLHSLRNAVEMLTDAGFNQTEINLWAPGHVLLSAYKGHV